MLPIDILRQSFLSAERPPPHWETDLSNEAYHALKSYVSSSCLRKFPKSGKTFLWSFNTSEEASEPQEFGTAFHQASLEPDAWEKLHAVMPKFMCPEKGTVLHANSNEYKRQKDIWLEKHKGRTVVTQKRFDEMRWMLDSFRSHPDAVLLMKSGIAERSGFYRDPVTGIPCRIRPDWHNEQLSCIVDIKTTAKDISKKAFMRALDKERYDISLAMYAEGTQIITGTPVLDTAIIVVQTVKPYECAVYPLSPRARNLGEMDYHVALSDLAESLKTNKWKPAQKRMEVLEHSASAYKEFAV
jgi:exodeoxyribonuclease VIII